MNQEKIGCFIAERRKAKGLTQRELAEILGITDRAVSKWERGKSLPDASLMLKLCGKLEITVNELLTGEVLEMNNYNEMLEKNLLEMVKQKEESDRKLLRLEIVIGYISSITFFILIFVASFVEMQNWIRILLIAFGLMTFAVGMHNCLKIEQTAGYYECQKCHHKYIPSYSSVLFAMHINRTRYMKCPECGKRSWQKKVLK